MDGNALKKRSCRGRERERAEKDGVRERERKGDRHTHRERDTGAPPPLFIAQSVFRS